jgi:hypothetical protein
LPYKKTLIFNLTTYLKYVGKLHISVRMVKEKASAPFPKNIWHSLVNLNLYGKDTEEKMTISTDVIGIQMQIWSTRLFMVLFLVAFSVLVIMTTVSKQLITAIVENPTVETYNNLESKYGDQVQCPCSNIDTPLGAYINITVTFHQVFSKFYKK